MSLLESWAISPTSPRICCLVFSIVSALTWVCPDAMAFRREGARSWSSSGVERLSGGLMYGGRPIWYQPADRVRQVQSKGDVTTLQPFALRRCPKRQRRAMIVSRKGALWGLAKVALPRAELAGPQNGRQHRRKRRSSQQRTAESPAVIPCWGGCNGNSVLATTRHPDASSPLENSLLSPILSTPPRKLPGDSKLLPVGDIRAHNPPPRPFIQTPARSLWFRQSPKPSTHQSARRNRCCASGSLRRARRRWMVCRARCRWLPPCFPAFAG